MMLWLLATPRRAISSNTALRKCRVWFLNKDYTPALIWHGLCGAAHRRTGSSTLGFLHSLDQRVSLLTDIFALCFSRMICPGPSFISMSLPSKQTAWTQRWTQSCLYLLTCALLHTTLPVKGKGQESWAIWWFQLSSMEKVVCFFFSRKSPSKFYQPKKPSPQCIALATLPTNLSPWMSFSLAHRYPAAPARGSIPWLLVFQRRDISASIWINLSNTKPFTTRFSIRTINHFKIMVFFFSSPLSTLQSCSNSVPLDHWVLVHDEAYFPFSFRTWPWKGKQCLMLIPSLSPMDSCSPWSLACFHWWGYNWECESSSTVLFCPLLPQHYMTLSQASLLCYLLGLALSEVELAWELDAHYAFLKCKLWHSWSEFCIFFASPSTSRKKQPIKACNTFSVGDKQRSQVQQDDLSRVMMGLNPVRGSGLHHQALSSQETVHIDLPLITGKGRSGRTGYGNKPLFLEPLSKKHQTQSNRACFILKMRASSQTLHFCWAWLCLQFNRARKVPDGL